MYVEVLVEIKAKNLDKTFTYKTDLNIKVGSRVLVPFGRLKLEGFVLKIHNNKPDYEVKDIISVIDSEPVLNSEMLKLGEYISKKTLCNLIHAYQTMLPNALKVKNGRVINKKMVSYIELIDKEYTTKSLSQNKIIDLLNKEGKVKKSELNKISVSSVNTLLKNNIIKESIEEEYRLNDDTIVTQDKKELTNEQKNVLSSIEYDKFKPYLLHGVTGSGKTEVYMRVIDNVLSENKEAIVLVPEISLTPQLVRIFKNRLAILHSGLSDGEKYDEWRKIERKEVSIVIGARSAIFAPFTNLGVIIIDEEHSTTYKQENTPKYNAIDIALYRAKNYNIPVILGSATPSIESYTRAKTGIYELLEMTKRVNDSLPKTILVDMKDEIKSGSRIISRVLREKINDRLSKGEQVIILLNRRGYSTVCTCHNCGFTLKCPKCDIPLTYHKSSNIMRCHYCGYGVKKPNICPECKSDDISFFGMGTERLEQYIKDEFKSARVVRMDQDTTSRKGAHEKIINDFKDLKYDILIGTQMISKGLDFPKVSLVGVINADQSLNIPDFRSSERTFQLLNQVAGRAGRSDIEGEVIFQGFNMDHYSIIDACNNDYLSFYKEELRIRKILNYSPYFNLCLIKIKDKSFEDAYREANKIVKHLNSKNMKDVIVLGPSPSMIPKINNIYNEQVIIKFKNTNEPMKELIFINERYRNSKVNVDIDINPIRL